MNFDRPHQPCCDRHNTCQACGEPTPCRTVLLAENAVLDARVTGLLEQLDEWRARCERTTALTTEGSNR